MALNLLAIVRNTALGTINNLMPTTAKLLVRGAVTTAFNPATNASEVRAADTETTISITPPMEFSDLVIDGTNIRRGDYKTVVSGADYSGDYDLATTRIEYNDVVYRIISIKRYITGQDTAAYELQLRL